MLAQKLIKRARPEPRTPNKQKMSENLDIQAVLQRACAQLMEHCDSVQIFVTVDDGPNDQTRAYHFGGGSYFTRLGQVQHWVDSERGAALELGRQKSLE
jgi:hypothetical protein